MLIEGSCKEGGLKKIEHDLRKRRSVNIPSRLNQVSVCFDASSMVLSCPALNHVPSSIGVAISFGIDVMKWKRDWEDFEKESLES